MGEPPLRPPVGDITAAEVVKGAGGSVADSRRSGSPSASPRLAGQRSRRSGNSNDQSDPRKGLLRRHKGIWTAVSGVLAALVVAWLTPMGPWLWGKWFPPDTVSVSISYPRGQCSSFIVPENSDAPSSGSAVGTPEWAAGNGAAQADPFYPGKGTGLVLVTISAKDSRPVTVTSLEFNVIEKKPGPLRGRYVENPCGEETVARYAEVDLDADPPQITASSAEVVSWGDYNVTPLRFPYKVTDEESENLLLIGSTGGYVEWTATIGWSDGEDSGQVTVDNDGEPLRTSLPPP